MRHIKDVLQKVYERKSRTQETLAEFQQALVSIQNIVPEHFKNIVRHATIRSYEKGILTLSLPRHELHPDVYFILHDLKDFFCRETGKNIRLVKFTAKNPS